MDVGEQVVPPDNPAIAVPKWQAARLKPAVPAIAPPDPVLEFVGFAGLYGVLPGGIDARQVGGVYGVGGSPLLQFVKSPPDVLEDRAVHMLYHNCKSHHRYEARNRLD